MFYYFKLFGNDCIINLNELSSFVISTSKDNLNVNLRLHFDGVGKTFGWQEIHANKLSELSTILYEMENQLNILKAKPFMVVTDSANVRNFKNQKENLQNNVKPLLIASKNTLLIYRNTSDNQSTILLNNKKEFSIEETVDSLIASYFQPDVLQTKKYSL